MNESCDVMVLYTNDWIWEFHTPEVCEIFENELEAALLKRIPNAKTISMAPPTILDDYFSIEPNYNTNLKLIRHSSQGNAKYPKDFNEIVEKVLALREDVTIDLMPAPDFLKDFDRVTKHPKNTPPIKEYLKLGNCFWYKLPEGYTEGGPKVIMEAQAAGLPIIADNHSGAKDRVVDGTGWLCDTIEDHYNIINDISIVQVRERGKSAREHARTAYNRMNWINNILGLNNE